MVFESRQKYRFGEFLLNPDENLLLRNGVPVSLTPKEFEALVYLVKNHGSLVEKSTLLDRIWKGSFVEESALSKCIWSIRKALGDDAKQFRFIQTVPKRGYRFVYEVTAIPDRPAESDATGSVDEESPTYLAIPDSVSVRESHRKNVFIFSVVGILIILIGVGVINSLRKQNAVSSSSFRVTRLTTDGKATQAVVSPDGQIIYYVKILGDRQNIRVRDLNTGDERELIAGLGVEYTGLSISPDGKALFFGRKQLTNDHNETFRISTSTTGVPQKLVSGTQGWTSISPDGSHISFVRCPNLKDENCSLYVADAETGMNERKLVTRPRPFRIGDSVFTPDGASLIFANGQSHTGGSDFRLDQVDLSSGRETSFSQEHFFNIRHIAWFGNSRSLAFTASRISSNNGSLWIMEAATGISKEVSEGIYNLSNISFDNSGSLGVATEISPDFRFSVFDAEGGSSAKNIALSGDLDVMPDGKIIFSSWMAGDIDIWSINADGTDLRQLTNGPAEERTAESSPDGRFIYFSSNRSGELQIWRMNSDGTDPFQITKRTGGYPISVKIDGSLVYFKSSIDNTLWVVAADGAEEERQIRKLPNGFTVSPDGTLAAYPEAKGETNVIALSDTDSGASLDSYEVGSPNSSVTNIRWSRDGKNIYYLQRAGSGTVSVYQLNISDRNTVKIRDVEVERVIPEAGFAVSADTKNIVIASGEWRHDLVLINGLK